MWIVLQAFSACTRWSKARRTRRSALVLVHDHPGLQVRRDLAGEHNLRGLGCHDGLHALLW
jgi:hypothetical protein